MSRPISIEELIKSEKPRFIKRSQRAAKVEAKVLTKRKAIWRDPEEEIVQVKVKKQSKPASKQFNFGWSEGDDTSAGFEPLVDFEQEDDLVVESGGHWSSKALEKMSSSDWRDLKDEFNIIVKGSKINPIRSWKESLIHPKIVEILLDLQLVDPTPIQRASIPIALSQQDIIGIAETGSGKTLAYIIPLLNYILLTDENYIKYEHMEPRNLNKPLGLILAPTRELANQITSELTKFCDKLHLRSVSIIGGHSYEETSAAIANGVHIVVATPGRLVDSLERRMISLQKCFYVIFDEADRMIDMGFDKSLSTIYDHLMMPSDSEKSIFHISKRITAMFTATFSDSINELTTKYLHKPVQLVIGKVGEKVDNIVQEFEYVQPKDAEKKFDKMVAVLKKHSRFREHSIIIFANYIKTVEELADKLHEVGYESITIHGSKSQSARERSIEDFKSGKKRILIATDVAARGIDIANVSLVINYQMTKKIDEYIHRIGRTGRAGNKGNSYTFIEEEDQPVFVGLRKFLKKNIPSWLANYQSQTINE